MDCLLMILCSETRMKKTIIRTPNRRRVTSEVKTRKTNPSFDCLNAGGRPIRKLGKLKTSGRLERRRPRTKKMLKSADERERERERRKRPHSASVSSKKRRSWKRKNEYGMGHFLLAELGQATGRDRLRCDCGVPNS